MCSQHVSNSTPHICPLWTYIGGPILGLSLEWIPPYIGGVSQVFELLFDGPIKEAYGKIKEKKISIRKKNIHKLDEIDEKHCC